MLRRTLAVLATALSAAALVTVPAAGPATAAGFCTFTPPARIYLYAEETDLPANVSGDCTPNGYGDWFSEGFAGASYYGFGDGESYSSIYVPDSLYVYGRQQWEPAGAVRDASCEDGSRSARRVAHDARLAATEDAAASDRASACDNLGQNRPYSDIRLGGYASMTASRTGSTITFLAGSGGWSPFSHKLVARPDIGGELQTRYADGTWHRVGNPVRTGANAKALIKFTTAATRTYRFAIYRTASYYERTSTPFSI